MVYGVVSCQALSRLIPLGMDWMAHLLGTFPFSSTIILTRLCRRPSHDEIFMTKHVYTMSYDSSIPHDH